EHMDLHSFLFYLIAVLTGLCAIAMVVTQNIVRAAAWLLFTLAGVSGIFFLLGANFVGATQLLVYVGGNLVFVVFGVMLTGQGPCVSMKTGAAEWGIAAAVGLLLYGVLSVSLLAPGPMDFSKDGPAPVKGEEMTRTTQLGHALLGVPQATPERGLTGIPPT